MATDYKLRISAKDNTKGGFNSVNKNVNKTQQSMKKLAGAFAGVFAIRQLVMFGQETLALADNIGKTADSIGVSTTFLQQYQFAAQQSGIETEQFNKALRFFSKGVGEAAQGTGLAKRAFEEMGLSIKDSSGQTKKSEALFKEFFVSLESIQEPFERNALLAQVFGAKVGITMANLIKDGSVAMEDLAASATGVIPEESIRQAEIFNDAMNELKRATLLPLQTAFIAVSTTVLEFLDLLGIVERKKSLGELEGELERINILFKEIAETGKFEFMNGLFKEYTPEEIKANEERKKSLEEQIALIKTQKTLTGVVESAFESTKFNKDVKDKITIVKSFADTIDGQLTTAFTNFFDATSKQFLDFKDLATSVARAVINELINVFLVQKLVGLAKGQIGKIQDFKYNLLTDGDTLFESSNEGGGFTGSGVRAGGIDGRGGFPAILHPNETVVDHTKGQGNGGATVNFNISTVDAAGFDQLLASRKGLITSIINNAMNNQGKMGVV